MFFCVPYVSSQKPNVENLNKRIRKYFPKKVSIDNLTINNVKDKCINLHNRPIKSLDSFTPKEAFMKVFF